MRVEKKQPELVDLQLYAGKWGASGRSNGPRLEATFNCSCAATVDWKGNVYVMDTFNQLVRKIDAKDGMVTTLAGTGAATFSDGHEASFYYSWGINCDEEYVYVADTHNSAVRRISRDGMTDTIVGVRGECTTEAQRLKVQMCNVIMRNGTLYLAIKTSNQILKVLPDGSVHNAVREEDRGRLEAFNVDADLDGTIFCTGGRRVFKITPDGRLEEIQVPWPSTLSGICVDLLGNLFLSSDKALLKMSRTGDGYEFRHLKQMNEELDTVDLRGMACNLEALYVVDFTKCAVLRLPNEVRWSTESHWRFPRKIRGTVEVLMKLALCHPKSGVPRHPEAQLWKVPRDVIFLLVQMIIKTIR